MADSDAQNGWNGDAARSAARDDDAQWNGPRSPSPRGAATPPRRERERSRSPVRRGGEDDRGRSERPGAGEANPGNNLHVSGLSNRVTDRDLEETFGKYGPITKAQVMYDPHSREPRGFAFVTFEKPEDAEAAIAALNGTDLHGRRMTVDKARRGRARTPTPGRYFGPPKKGGEGGHGRRGYDAGPYDRGYGPPPRGYPPPLPPRDAYDRYGPPPGRLSPPPLRDPYDRYGRGPPPPLPPRDYPPRDRDYLPPPPRALDYPPPRDYPPRGPPSDYPPPRGGYRDLSPPPRSRYDDIPPPPRGGGGAPGRYADLPPRRYDDVPPRRY